MKIVSAGVDETRIACGVAGSAAGPAFNYAVGWCCRVIDFTAGTPEYVVADCAVGVGDAVARLFALLL